MPVVSTSSPPLRRSVGSGSSTTCAQRTSRPSSEAAAATSGRPRRTTGSSRTSAIVSIRTVTHCRPTRAAVSIAAADANGEGAAVRSGVSGGEQTAVAITDNATHALLIDGEDVATARTRDVIDPATGEPIATVADATAEDAERAVEAARAAYRRGDWSRITPGERAAAIDKLADLLEERADEFARVESRNTGKPLKFSSAFDVPLSIDNLRFSAAAARTPGGKASGESLGGYTSTIRREPLGVTAAIAPWNYPLNMACWKIGPAL